MWLFTTRGFYSIVEDTSDPEGGTVLVRARAREDLERLVELLPDLEIFETPSADYRFRARLPKATFAAVAFNLVSEIGYPNFKDAVAAEQGHEREALYHRVWATMNTLQRGA